VHTAARGIKSVQHVKGKIRAGIVTGHHTITYGCCIDYYVNYTGTKEALIAADLTKPGDFPKAGKKTSDNIGSGVPDCEIWKLRRIVGNIYQLVRQIGHQTHDISPNQLVAIRRITSSAVKESVFRAMDLGVRITDEDMRTLETIGYDTRSAERWLRRKLMRIAPEPA